MTGIIKPLSWKKGEVNPMQPLIIEMRNPEIQRGSDLSKGTPACGTAQPELKSRALPLHYVSLSSHGPWLKFLFQSCQLWSQSRTISSSAERGQAHFLPLLWTVG